MYTSSSVYGNGVSNPVTRTIGPRRYSIAFSARIALISAPYPPVRGASYTTTARPVFFTDDRTVGSSRGTKVRRSITSASTPFSAAFVAASRQTWAMYPYAIRLTSFPDLRTAACPRGTVTSPSGTSSRDERYSFFGSRKRTGSGSRIDDVRRPFASFGVDGTTTFKPGVWQKYASVDWL